MLEYEAEEAVAEAAAAAAAWRATLARVSAVSQRL
jgi:hypothetical protein